MPVLDRGSTLITNRWVRPSVKDLTRSYTDTEQKHAHSQMHKPTYQKHQSGILILTAALTVTDALVTMWADMFAPLQKYRSYLSSPVNQSICLQVKRMKWLGWGCSCGWNPSCTPAGRLTERMREKRRGRWEYERSLGVPACACLIDSPTQYHDSTDITLDA